MSKPRISRTVVTKKDVDFRLKRMADNIAVALNEEARKSLSIGICLDAICSVLDSFVANGRIGPVGDPRKFTDCLKEELERRNPKKPEVKPDDNQTSNE